MNKFKVGQRVKIKATGKQGEILENALNELIQQQTKFLKKLGGTYN